MVDEIKAEPTLYDRLLARLKNRPIVVAVVLTSVVVAGGAKLVESLRSIYLTTIKEQPEASPKIRAQYMVLEGHSLPLLIDGRLAEPLAKKLGGTPIVWKNDVYDELNVLYTKYSIDKSKSDYELFINEQGQHFDLGKLPETFRFMPGTVLTDFHGLRFDVPSVGSDSKDAILSAGPPWIFKLVTDPNKLEAPSEVLERLKAGIIWDSNLTMMKNLNCLDGIKLMSDVGSAHQEFYQHVTEKVCPQEFFFVQKKLDVCRKKWSVELIAPTLKIRVLIVQNIGERAVKLEQIRLGQSSAGPTFKLGPESGTKDYQVGDGTLLQTERLVIPLELFLSHDRQTGVRDEFLRPIRLSKVDVQAALAGKPSVEIVSSESAWLANVASEMLDLGSQAGELKGSQEKNESGGATIGKNSKNNVDEQSTLPVAQLGAFTPDFSIPTTIFPIGTKFNPKSIVIDRVRTPLHTLNGGGMLISASNSSGSCPYLSATDSQGKSSLLGNVLTGRSNAGKAGSFSKWVPEWPVSFKISELEDEVSHLSNVEFVCRQEHGSEEVFSSADFSRIRGNRSAVKLESGEGVSFSVPHELTSLLCADRYVRVTGFYIPGASRTAVADAASGLVLGR